jgi:hypothetical protein
VQASVAASSLEHPPEREEQAPVVDPEAMKEQDRRPLAGFVGRDSPPIDEPHGPVTHAGLLLASASSA